MTLDEFKALKWGVVVQYLDQAPLYIRSVDREYDYSTRPPTETTYEIFAHNGTSLKASDPLEWIQNTRILPDYEGDCPSCHKFDLWLVQGSKSCAACGYICND